MTWTYTGNPSSVELDEIRALIQDVDSSFPLLSDEELYWLRDKWEPIYDSTEMVAAVAAALISRKFAGVVSVSADGVEVDVSSLSDRYRQMAQDLRDEYARLQEVGEVDMSSILTDFTPDPTIIPLSFSRGMHDNSAAGLQDFGGWWPQAWNITWPLLPGYES